MGSNIPKAQSTNQPINYSIKSQKQGRGDNHVSLG